MPTGGPRCFSDLRIPGLGNLALQAVCFSALGDLGFCVSGLLKRKAEGSPGHAAHLQEHMWVSYNQARLPGNSDVQSFLVRRAQVLSFSPGNDQMNWMQKACLAGSVLRGGRLK